MFYSRFSRWALLHLLSFHFYSLIGGTSIVAFQLKVFLLTYINIIKYYFRKVKKFFNFVLNNLLNLIAPTIEVLIQPVPASPRGGLFLMPYAAYSTGLAAEAYGSVSLSFE